MEEQQNQIPWGIDFRNIISVPQDTMVERPNYVFFDWTEITELREQVRKIEDRVRKLEEQSERRLEQRIIPIQFLESRNLKLKQSISVNLEYIQKDKIWIVDSQELNICGTGRDEDDALKDFKIILEEKYFDLKEDKDKLGPILQKEWLIFTEILQEK